MRRKPSSASANTKNALLERERDELLEQQKATAEVLRLISVSSGDLQRVFDAILENATRICEAKFGVLHRFDGEYCHLGAQVGTPPEYAEFYRGRGQYKPTPGGILDRVIRTKRGHHTADAKSDAVLAASARLGGARTQLLVPMLKDDVLIGVISIYRQEVRPFTDKQIELVKNFAAQAVIAIENTRLLNELRQRTTDLTESLDQQTATSEVLRVISSSPGELEPVFQAVLEKATRICEANFGILFRLDDGVVHLGASLGVPLALAEFMQSVRRPGPHSATARAMRTGQVIHILDAREERGYREGDPMLVFGVDKVGIRTLVAAPMLKDKVPIGSIGIYRTEVRPFTDKQIELLRNFAAQAVIAIENTRLLNELRDSLEQQTATAEVLSVISSSPGELEPVFQAMLENATRICEAKFGTMYFREGDGFRAVAMHGAPPAYVESRLHKLFHPGPTTGIGRVLETKKAVQIEDASADQGYTERDPLRVSAVELGGVRTLLDVPMLKENEVIGAVAIYREVVRPFTDKQVALVQNFANQAVIAIENTRLLNELRQRTDDLSESLEQQTATSEVLKVISSSPGELEPVFNAMLANAVRICDAKFGMLYRYDNETFDPVALFGVPPAHAEFIQQRGSFRPPAGSGLDSLVRTKDVVRIADDSASPWASNAAKLGGARSRIVVPMLKENALIGAIVIYRQEVRPFTDKQVDLLKNFADQAVIAIENTRLLSELRQSLEQQTATSEVLSVISSSPGELGPVFKTMLENATRICHAKFGVLQLYEGRAFRIGAIHNAPPAFAEAMARRELLMRPTPQHPFTRMVTTKEVVQIADLTDSPAYKERDYGVVMLVELASARTFLAVPMLKENEVVGVIAIYRQEVLTFTDKQIELVKNFAAQAVIAIENTRLLSELRESLEQQTATSKVLSVISSSPGELEPVFQAMLENAVRICDAKFGNLFLYEGGAIRPAAMHGAPSKMVEFFQQNPTIHPKPGGTVDRALKTKQVVCTVDEAANQIPSLAVELGGARSHVVVPMLKENELVGVFGIYRHEVRAFTDKQIELLTNFASQAVIAIENTRLLNELRESLEQQTATADVLRVISSSPGDLEPVFQAMLENAVRICEAKFGSLLHFDGEAFRFAAEVGTPQEFAEFSRKRGPFRPLPGSHLDRLMRTKQVSHTADYAADAIASPPVTLGGARSTVDVPMLRDGELIGAFSIYRQEVRPFSEKQIELVQNFAAQAVIAIENTRLLNELRESLEQQTATSEVLSVISSSPGELEPVFQAMLANATRLCEANFGLLHLRESGAFRVGAMHNVPAAFAQAVALRGPLLQPGPAHPIARMAAAKQVIHVFDYAEDPAYGQREPAAVRLVELAGARSVIAVPMLNDDELVGAITIFRQEVRPFTDKQIELVKNFAAQAVIAIENTRLLNELREFLQQQTATSEVLGIISSSPGELEPVFKAMLANAVRICEAKFGNLYLHEGGGLRMVAEHDVPPMFAKARRNRVVHPAPDSALSGVIGTKQTTHIPDLMATRSYEERHVSTVEAVEVGGVRTVVAVPLLKENELVGIIAIYRQEVHLFTDKQVALLTNFAAQAVIAIENARLLNELRQRTTELEDKGHQLEVASQHKSQFLANMSHELRTPLNAILGYTELMADGIYGELPEKTMAVLKRLESNGRHLLGLINDVLDLSKIEAGQLVLELTDYSLEDIAQTARSTLEPLAADKKLAFKVEVAPKMPPGHGDGRRLTQVVINLVGNAIKFTDAGEVVIKATATDGSFHLSVRDTGPGISAADRAKLFQEFQQADNAITRKKGGTGLGLAISKRIIEMHGGKIWLESQIGQGSTFSFTVPVRVERQVEPA